MVAFLVVCVLISGVLGYFQHADGHAIPGGIVAFGLASLVALGVVLVQMFRHPAGVKDWIQGGVVDVTELRGGRLRWIDWAVVFTRTGTIDPKAATIRFERRLLFGLIPVASVARPLSDYHHVEVSTEQRHTHSGHKSRAGTLTVAGVAFGGGDGGTRGHRVVGYTYSVTITDQAGERLVLLDLATGLTARREKAFCERMCGLVEAALKAPRAAPDEETPKKKRKAR